MDTFVLERVRQGLLRKRDSLAGWFHATPLAKKEVLLGPSKEQSVGNRIDVIDDSTIVICKVRSHLN